MGTTSYTDRLTDPFGEQPQLRVGRKLAPSRSSTSIDLIFFFSFFVYFNPIQITNTDVQPIAYLLIGFYMLVNIARTYFHRYEAVFLLVIGYSIVRVDFLFLYQEIDPASLLVYIKTTVNIFFAMLLFYFVSRNFHRLNTKQYLIYVGIWIVVAVLQSVAFYTPYSDSLDALFGRIIFRSHNTANLATGRGVSSLSPEPSFAAVQFIQFMLMNYYLYRVRSIITRRQYWNCNVALIIGVLLTKSVTGYILLAALTICIVILEFSMRKVLLILGALVLVTLFYYDNLMENPGVFVGRAAALVSIVDDPQRLFYDQSMSHRITQLLVSLVSLPDNFFMGHGAGTFRYYAQEYADSSIFENTDRQLYEPYLNTDVILSMLGGLIFSFGVIGLFQFYLWGDVLFTMVRVKHVRREVFVYAVMSGVISLLLSLSSQPIMHPTIWILLGIVLNHIKYRVITSAHK